MAKIQIKNSFITSSAQITISSSLVRFSDNIRAKGITGSFSGSFAGSNLFVQGGNSFGTTALLGTNDNQPLALETNGSEKLRITAAGNVGIGTSNPIAKLHTVGSNGSTDYVYQQWSYTSNVGVYDLILKQTVTSNVVRYNFSMNNASTAYNDVLVLDRGCVGIGTSFPLSKLDVRGTMYVNYGSNGTGYIQTNGTDSDLQITTATNLTTLLNTGTSGAMAFGAGNSERMRILSNGNVGIGTTTPASILHLNGTAPTILTLSSTSYPSTYLSTFGVDSGARAFLIFGNNGENQIRAGRTATGGYLDFYTNNTVGQTTLASDGNFVMRLSAGGLVGIGTTTPTAKLDVANGGLSVSGWSNNNSGTTGGVEIGWDGSQGIFQVYDRVNANYEPILINGSYTMFYVSGTERARLTSTGNLGIGTTSASRKLIVFGDAAIATNSGGIVLASYDADTGNIRPSVANGSILISDDSGLLTRGTEFLNGGGLIVQSLSGFAPLEVKSNGNTLMYVTSGGNVGIGTTAPVALLDVRGNTKFGSSLSNTHQFTGSVNFGGSVYNDSITEDRFEYFSLQPYIEGGSFPSNVFSLSGTFPTFVTMTGSACPFGKVAYNVSYYEAIGDFIPVQAGETLYGEIWAYRSAGATGTAGVFYCGIARYDKDKRPIDSNAGLNYFIVQNATVPSNSAWTKYSNTTTLPLTHTPFGGSDGGPVRYVRPYIIVNYTVGTVPTYWAAFKIRKQQLTRDLGAVVVSGSLGIGTSSPSSKLHIYENANRVSYLAQNSNHIARFEAFGTATAIDTSASNGIFYRINGTDIVKFAADGNVGIGTSSPAYKLDVNTANDSAIRIRNGGGGANNGLALSVGSGSPWLDIIEGVEFRIKGNTYANIGTWNSGNNTKVLIDSNGNIGIGTTTPGGKLEVRTNAASNYVFSGTSTSGYTTTFTMDDTASYFGHDSGVRSLILRTNSTARLTVTGNGNVGIGTTSPAYKFELVGSGSVSIVNIAGRIRSNVGSDVFNTGTALAFTNTTSNANAYAYIGSRIDAAAAGDNAQSLIFATNATNTLPTEKLRITSTGNVGIGSAAPAYKLDVAGGDVNFATGTVLRFGTVAVLNESSNANDIYANIRVIRNMSSTSQDGMYINYNSTGTTGAHLRFFANGTSERMRIDASSGNVGIGTTSPTQKLHVLTTGGSTTAPNIVATFQANTATTILAGGGTAIKFVGVSSGGNLQDYDQGMISTLGYVGNNQHGMQFWVKPNASTVLTVGQTIDNNGNVGIGSTAPAYKLDVNGTFRSTGDLWTNGNIIINRAGAYLYINGTNSDAEIVWQANGSNRWAAGMNVGDATENFNVYNYTTATTNFTILKANGNVGIGSTAPAYKLDVNGSIGISGLKFVDQSGNYFRIFEPSGNVGIYLGNNSDPANYYDNSTHFFRNRGGSSNYAIINSNGNLGIGTTSVTAPLHIYRASNPWVRLNGGGNYSYIRFDDGTSNGYLFKNTSSDTSNGALAGAMYTYTDSGKAFQHIHSGTPLFTILSGGNVGVGTTAPLSKLNSYGSGSNLSVFRVDGGNGTLFEVTDQLSGSLFSVNDVSGLPLLEVFSNNRVVAGKYGSNALVVSGSSVGIGTSRPAYRLQVSGSFAATTKSFVINHPDPAKSDKQLVHGVTEGPEHTVFVRGKLLNDNIIQLPDYWQYLVDEESITVTLTPNKYYQQLYVKNVTDTTIEVGSETDKPINCYYYIVGERKDIPKLITEI